MPVNMPIVAWHGCHNFDAVKLSLISRGHYRISLPRHYLTTSSDYQWSAGQSILVVDDMGLISKWRPPATRWRCISVQLADDENEIFHLKHGGV